MAKTDFIKPDVHVRGVKSGALRRITLIEHDNVHWCDEFGHGVCTIQWLKNWMVDGEAKATVAETDKIDRCMLEASKRIDAQVNQLTNLLNRDLSRPKPLPIRAYRPPGWANRLIRELSDSEFVELCQAIEQSERIGMF